MESSLVSCVVVDASRDYLSVARIAEGQMRAVGLKIC